MGYGAVLGDGDDVARVERRGWRVKRCEGERFDRKRGLRRAWRGLWRGFWGRI